ncbi:carbohydrate ABC transporter permease [Cohnella sp.]|uniref:carbohydrate ABC transporter permease n=1 Tax=Cohnella sp. TaxID=1883426 RepID=UPI00356A1AB1
MKTKQFQVRPVSLLNGLVLIALCVVTMYPIVYVFMYSISDAAAAASRSITVYPIEFTLDNYRSIFVDNRILKAFWISVERTVLGSLLHLLVTGLAAYSFSKENLIMRRKLLIFFIIPLYFSGGLLPFYVQIVNLGLYNNFLVYILPTAMGIFNMLVMKVFFEQLPRSLEESAKVDGAGEFTVFARIILPSSMPVIATIIMFIGVQQWNSWFDGLLFTNKADMAPLQTLLYKIILENQATSMEQLARLANANVSVTPEAIKMTTLIISTVPMLVIYPFLQKYFVKGMMIGAVKG